LVSAPFVNKPRRREARRGLQPLRQRQLTLVEAVFDNACDECVIPFVSSRSRWCDAEGHPLGTLFGRKVIRELDHGSIGSLVVAIIDGMSNCVSGGRRRRPCGRKYCELAAGGMNEPIESFDVEVASSPLDSGY
jgi:hypothetical protein